MHFPIEELLESNRKILTKLALLEDKINEKPLKKYSPQDIVNNTPLGIQTVWAACKDGRIKAQKFGRKYLIPADEFNRVCKDVKSIKYQRLA